METPKDTFEKLLKNMTQEKASYVKMLRVERGYTWGRISDRFATRYPDDDVFQSSIIGREICNAAMSYLNESVDDGWN